MRPLRDIHTVHISIESMNRQAGPEGTKFLSDENRRMLYGILSKDVMKRGVTLTPKLAEQLDVYLNHYVDEV
jgi:hypothetical protein